MQLAPNSTRFVFLFLPFQSNKRDLIFHSYPLISFDATHRYSSSNPKPKIVRWDNFIDGVRQEKRVEFYSTDKSSVWLVFIFYFYNLAIPQSNNLVDRFPLNRLKRLRRKEIETKKQPKDERKRDKKRKVIEERAIGCDGDSVFAYFTSYKSHFWDFGQFFIGTTGWRLRDFVSITNKSAGFLFGFFFLWLNESSVSSLIRWLMVNGSVIWDQCHLIDKVDWNLLS